MSKVVLIGYSGWPLVLNATSNKQGSIAQALKSAGVTVSVSNYVSYSTTKRFVGIEKGIKWKFWAHRRSLFGLRLPMRLFRISGSIKEGFWLLLSRPSVIIVADRNPYYLLSRLIISRVIRSKVLITLVEDPLSSFSGKLHNQKLKLYNFVLTKADGLLPISKKLDDYVNGLGVIKTLILGPLYDFGLQDLDDNFVDDTRLTFCATAGYREQFEFCCSIYDLLEAKKFSQVWVVSGNENEVNRVRELAKERNIEVLSGIEDELLRKIYRSSGVLLLPMFNSDRDFNRFPNKIAEYLASGRPIVTSRVGEMVKLIDQGLVFEAEAGNASDYARTILNTLASKKESNIERSRQLFDIRIIGDEIRKFLENV